MKVLVTGGAGYIGSHTLVSLAEYAPNTDIVVYDNLATSYREAVLYGTLIEADLADTAALQKVFNNHKFDAVIHFAASCSVDESIRRPWFYYLNNTCNTLRLLEQCRQHEVPYFIFSSTAAVYGIAGGSRIDEDHSTVPINAYGQSKLMSEQMLKDIAESCGMKYVTFRYYNVAGADVQARIGMNKPHPPEHLISAACRAAAGLEDGVTIFGTDYNTPDGTCVRDYVHVTDLADAHVAALHYLKFGGDSQLLNYGYGKGFSVREILRLVQEVTEVNFPITEGPARVGDPPVLVADNTKLKNVLNCNFRFDDVATVIKSAWTWELKLKKSRRAC